ncbi:MAG: hypothetical protein LIO75_04755 [Lachnospiraceae bacterium]|nr:hypothetical protein [Lachnospiraceae bacterium]
MASYNLKRIEYKEFVQYRIYNRTIKRNDENEPIQRNGGDAHTADAGTDCNWDEDYISLYDGAYCVEMECLPTAAELEEKKKHSMEVSVNRTVQTIYSYAQSNKWDWFVTLTFRRDLDLDVKDYGSVVKKLTKWLNNQRAKCPDLKYLFVPELHKDGAWHFHGLLAGADALAFTDSGRVAVGSKAYVRTDENADHETIYNMDNWRYGFSTATKVNSSCKASSYICKYITKDVVRHTGRRRRFYPSNNLEKPAVSEHLFDREDLDSLLESMADDIGYIKTQAVGDAQLAVTYVHVMKGGEADGGEETEGN